MNYQRLPFPDNSPPHHSLSLLHSLSMVFFHWSYLLESSCTTCNETYKLTSNCLPMIFDCDNVILGNMTWRFVVIQLPWIETSTIITAHTSFASHYFVQSSDLSLIHLEIYFHREISRDEALSVSSMNLPSYRITTLTTFAQ